MNAIYKYQLPVKEKYEIELPKNAEIIRVEGIEGMFYLWAIVDTDPDVKKEKRYLEFYKTGQPIEAKTTSLVFIGWCKLFIGQELCLYVFENIGPENNGF